MVSRQCAKRFTFLDARDIERGLVRIAWCVSNILGSTSIVCIQSISTCSLLCIRDSIREEIWNLRDVEQPLYRLWDSSACGHTCSTCNARACLRGVRTWCNAIPWRLDCANRQRVGHRVDPSVDNQKRLA